MGSEVAVLMVDDDREDYLLTEELVAQIDGGPYRLEWVADYVSGLRALRQNHHDICLLDYRLGAHTGLEFIREAKDQGCSTPIIVLTGHAGDAIEREALAAGASDYLVKGKLDAEALWRALRHAVERNRALQALRDRDQLFRAVFNTALDAMLIADDQGRYVDANPSALDLLGVTRDQLLIKRVVDFAPSQQAHQTALTWSEFLRVGTQTGEWELQRPDGERRVLEFRATAHILPGRHLSLVRDITERRRAEALRARLAAIVESAEDAIVGQDLDGIVQEWNGGAERLYRCSAANAVGRSILRFVPDDRLDEWHALQATVRSGGTTRSLETVRVNAEGTRVPISLSIAPLTDEAGRVIGASAIARDISETKDLRTRLAIADRMASVGTLAAGVAHEINNPLAAVMANLEMAAQDVSDLQGMMPAHPLFANLATGVRDAFVAADRVHQIVRDLKLFSRPDEEHAGPVDIRRTMESTLRMVWNEIRHRARLVKDYGDTPPVDGSESRIGQVFMNILVNAAQAIPEGNVETNEIRVVTRTAGDRVQIDISDTGQGIPPDKMDRIFEPFYTTKALGVGTGLGLSICHGIVSSLNGELTVRSEVGRGTTFRISLPASVLHQVDDRLTPAPFAGAGPRARILVVDDEPLLVKTFTKMLAPHHDVVGVTDARDALGQIAAGVQFDVLLCDTMMPQMTGMEFYAELQQLAPDMAARTLFLTGGAFTARARAFLDTVPNRSLEKPIDSHGLLTAIREIVGLGAAVRQP